MGNFFNVGIDIVQNNRIKTIIIPENIEKNILNNNKKSLNINFLINKFIKNEVAKYLNENFSSNLNDNLKKFQINIAFLERIYTKYEITLSLKSNNIINYFSSRFAAKEACVKALKTGFGKGISYKSVEIITNNGIPEILLKAPLFDMFNDKRLFLSISHENDYSIAIVLVENKN
jgi:holo-[acyl-carrier protein] synthase